MRARLGFAIATSVDPDILLLDEVLADRRRQLPRRSRRRGSSRSSAAAKAVVLVTHDMNWVTEYCNRAILIERGELVDGGRAGGRRRAPSGPHRGGACPNPAEAARRPGSGPEDRQGPLSRASPGGESAGRRQRRRRAAIRTLTAPATPNAPARPRQSTQCPDVAVHAPAIDDAGEALTLERDVVGQPGSRPRSDRVGPPGRAAFRTYDWRTRASPVSAMATPLIVGRDTVGRARCAMPPHA